VVLNASDFPTYFKAIETERTLAANNAHTDPRTSVFSEPYLRPLGINSLLDVPIWVNGEMIGVVCHEHVGDFRKWTTDEETFAYIMGNIVGMTIESIMQEEHA
jgi:GAF domain-containing protein